MVPLFFALHLKIQSVTLAGHAGFAAHSAAFLAHKLAYAALLADYGRVQDATRYCASVQARHVLAARSCTL